MRLIDADVLKEELIRALHEPLMDIDEAIDVAVTTIEDAPTVDAVEVVRCKDCRYYHVYWESNGHTEKGYGSCDWINDNSVREDHFCSWGERKEDASKID